MLRVVPLYPFSGLAIMVAVSCSSPRPARGPNQLPSVAKERGATMSQAVHQTNRDMANLQSGASWRTVNDGVMGGRSEGQFQVHEDRAVFSGNLSRENGGGFASVRTTVESSPSPDVSGIAIRVLGDGKRYQFRIRTDQQWDGPAYRKEFVAPAGKWVEVNLPLSEFEMSFRGRTLPDAPPINAAEIRQLGFLIANKQWGPFRLEVAWIRAEAQKK